MTDVVLVTHQGLGEALRAIAETILGDAAPVAVVTVPADGDPARARDELERLLRSYADGDAPLVLTDLPGATPHNVAACAAAAACPAAPVISGLSLPMLLRAINHRQRPAVELAAFAAEGARRALEPSDGA
jgi:mannose/fructose-specific phosphotransferase system component IIA